MPPPSEEPDEDAWTSEPPAALAATEPTGEPAEEVTAEAEATEAVVSGESPPVSGDVARAEEASEEARPAASEPPPAPGEEAAPASETRARADSAEAIDVGAAEEAPVARPSKLAPPPPSMKRPPRLPEGGAAVTATPGAVFGTEAPSLAQPIGMSQLGALTAKPAGSRGKGLIALAFAALLGVGGVVLFMGRSAKHPEPPTGVREEPGSVHANDVPTTPTTPPPPKAAEEPANVVAVPAAEVTETETAKEPPRAEKVEPAPVENTANTAPREEPKAAEPSPPPEAPKEKPKPVAVATTVNPTPRPRSDGAVLHKPSPTRSAPGSTYKPGGI